MNPSTDEATLQQMQRAVDAWISQWEEGYFSPLSNLARLIEEVGELSRELNDRHGDKPKKAGEADSEVAEELGDILFVVICIANSLEIDLHEALAAVMQKYDVRDAQRWTARED
jgi:NTP pyrophosphatase (non-canonical NTP hydrolase)